MSQKSIAPVDTDLPPLVGVRVIALDEAHSLTVAVAAADGVDEPVHYGATQAVASHGHATDEVPSN